MTRMFKIMSRSKYDSLIRENTELKNAKVNLEDKLDQLKAEKAVNSKYNIYPIPATELTANPNLYNENY